MINNQTSWHHAKNILCIRPDNMGDVLMTTPAFRALKVSFPQTSLTLLTSKAGSKVAPFIPEIDEIITIDLPWVKSLTYTDVKELTTTIEVLRRKKFDGAIIFTVFSQNALPSALLAYLSDIPLRLAYCHEKPYQLLTNWIPDPEPQQLIRHEVIRQLNLVESIGATTKDQSLSCSLPAGAKEDALHLVENHGINPRNPWLIIHPGASSTKRLYSVAGWKEVAKMMIKSGFQIVVTGTDSERNLTEPIAEAGGSEAISLAEKLTVIQFMGLIASSPLLISVNTGAVHLAAAFGTPVVDLYALTNPQHTPWNVPHKVLYFPVVKNEQDSSVLPIIPEGSHPLTSPGDVVNAAVQLLTARISETHQQHYH